MIANVGVDKDIGGGNEVRLKGEVEVNVSTGDLTLSGNTALVVAGTNMAKFGASYSPTTGEASVQGGSDVLSFGASGSGKGTIQTSVLGFVSVQTDNTGAVSIKTNTGTPIDFKITLPGKN